jgi:putative membrane protein
MKLVTDILIGLVAVQHVAFAYLEMFLWKKPAGRKVFRTTEEFANESAVLAANQGLYNLFLVAGLVWGMVARDPQMAGQIKTFFLACVFAAGIFGGLTVRFRLFLIQGLPALIVLLLLRLAVNI